MMDTGKGFHLHCRLVVLIPGPRQSRLVTGVRPKVKRGSAVARGAPLRMSGGLGGIRTRGGVTPTPLQGTRLRPLGHKPRSTIAREGHPRDRGKASCKDGPPAKGSRGSASPHDESTSSSAESSTSGSSAGVTWASA